MSDFTEACPLFYEGVESMYTIPVNLQTTTTTSTKQFDGLVFGVNKKVVGASMCRLTALAGTSISAGCVYICKNSTTTVVATCRCSNTSGVNVAGKMTAGTVTAANQYFSATDVLIARNGVKAAAGTLAVVTLRLKDGTA